MSVPMLHFSDVLCVYAFVAQVRIDELKRQFPTEVMLDFHFCQVFGDTREKIARGWSDRGGFEGYNRHVLSVAEQFEHVRVHPEVWTKHAPTGSLSAHLFINAVSVLETEERAPSGAAEAAAWAVRRAFFEAARDISSQKEQQAIAEELGLPSQELARVYAEGHAHAALARDIELARKHEVVLSPTLIFNDGRQRLNGNVGFRIIEANDRELLRVPGHGASWC